MINKSNKSNMLSAISERLSNRQIDKDDYDLTLEEEKFLNESSLKELEMIMFNNTNFSKHSPYKFKYQ